MNTKISCCFVVDPSHVLHFICFWFISNLQSFDSILHIFVFCIHSNLHILHNGALSADSSHTGAIGARLHQSCPEYAYGKKKAVLQSTRPSNLPVRSQKKKGRSVCYWSREQCYQWRWREHAFNRHLLHPAMLQPSPSTWNLQLVSRRLLPMQYTVLHRARTAWLWKPLLEV